MCSPNSFCSVLYDFIHFVGIECYKPANGESVTMETKHNIPVDISLKLLKREASMAGENQATIHTIE